MIGRRICITCGRAPSLLSLLNGRKAKSIGVSVRNNHFKAPHLGRCEANYASLTPLSTFERTVLLYPSSMSYVYGSIERTWGDVSNRVCQFASALVDKGIKKGDVVSFMCSNIPPIFEAHFAVPGAGAVLHCINTRLDAIQIAYQLRHSESKIVFVDSEFTGLIQEVKAILEDPNSIFVPGASDDYQLPTFINIVDYEYGPAAEGTIPRNLIGDTDYESFISTGDSTFSLVECEDEWDAISLNYTSGTTGNPKGVVNSYRGVYLNSVGNVVEWGMERFSKLLWIVPMFHSNGWLFPWTLAKVAGCSYLMRNVRADLMFDLIQRYKIGYMCGAPITMTTMLSYPKRFHFSHQVKMWAAGAPPPPAVIEKFTNEIGVSVQTAYGLTETYGPITTHLQDPEWHVKHKLSKQELLERCTFQNRDAMVHDLKVLDPETMQEVPEDGKTTGEVMIKGNMVMKGYFKNPSATEEAFAGGWFHSGDLAVRHPNGRFQIKDRSKDIIISGGENISSIEVENIMLGHPSILEVAIIAMPHDKWGEVPCAFVTLTEEAGQAGQAAPTEQEMVQWCRQRMAAFQTPKRVVFTALPKTSTGKVQKNLLRKMLPADPDQQ